MRIKHKVLVAMSTPPVERPLEVSDFCGSFVFAGFRIPVAFRHKIANPPAVLCIPRAPTC